MFSQQYQFPHLEQERQQHHPPEDKSRPPSPKNGRASAKSAWRSFRNQQADNG